MILGVITIMTIFIGYPLLLDHLPPPLCLLGAGGLLPLPHHSSCCHHWERADNFALVQVQRLIRFQIVFLKRYLRFCNLRTPNNLLILSLCLSGILMIFTFPMFLVNLYHRGPYLGVAGANVSYYVLGP